MIRFALFTLAVLTCASASAREPTIEELKLRISTLVAASESTGRQASSTADDQPEDNVSQDATAPGPSTRLVLLSQPWCHACPAAKRAAKKSGVAVEVVEGAAARGQAILHKVPSYPAWILFDENDRALRIYTGPSNAEGVRIMAGVSKAKAATKAIPRSSHSRHVLPQGWHSHKCNSCGTVWSHTGREGDHHRLHSCPQCGRYQPIIHRFGQ